MIRVNGYQDGVYPCVIGTRSHGPESGAASTMRYNITVNFPAGAVAFTGVAPAWEREPDTVMVNAIKPGTGCACGIVAGVLQLYARELPDRGPCT